MKKYFLLFFLFFLFINIQPASGYVSGATTCCTLSGCFDVKGTCSTNADCGSDEYCDYWGALCAGFGGPCKPLDCAGCSVAVNNQCVPQVKPPSTPNCCSYPCYEGGSGYSASLYDQTCYSLTNIDNDANNCGTCGNICTGGKVCTSGSCVCPSGTEWSSVQNKCITPTCTDCIDGTRCLDPNPVCSSATPGNRCVKNPITNMGELKADPTCVGCAATLSLKSGTITSGNTCTITASVSGGCISKAFEIKKGSTSMCTGTTDATGAGSCPFTQTGTAVDSFDLWIDGIKKTRKVEVAAEADREAAETHLHLPHATTTEFRTTAKQAWIAAKAAIRGNPPNPTQGNRFF